MAASSVMLDLARWGTQGTSPVPQLAEARRYCRRLAQTQYENFPVVSWLLPGHLHQHFYNIYAYCRWADDLADETDDPEKSLQLLGWWRDELENCYSNRVSHPVFVALSTTIEEFRIPPEPFLDLITAFEQDQRVQEYEHFEQLLEYCRYSANPVGRLILYLCECLNPTNVAYSDSICTGLQLANFWQDVSRDYSIGRIYLPREDRLRFDYRDEDMRARRTNPAFLKLMEFEVERARLFLAAGKPLMRQLPGRLRLDIELFRRGGLLILDEIQRIDYRVWDRRPVVRKSRLFRTAIESLFCFAASPLQI